MKATLETINQMQVDGLIGRYAIGGAVGATFYLEPAATLDIGVFISLPNPAAGQILSLAPIYEYLTARGCRVEKEYIIVGNWPVQFLPPSDALDEEALGQAIEADVDGIKTYVMTAEHLVAIALRTGRAKDKIRVEQFIESGVLDAARLEDILTRHGLLAKWNKLMRQYREENE
ncbi:MAG TPA: hypothetical protein VMZ06_02815 [Candidatus Bathyarchaeia archaeon]|nr:hypothetical protein [Candidatus Bathyarchaeia archaeon]